MKHAFYVILFLLMFTMPAHAVETQVFTRQYDALGLEELEESRPLAADNFEISSELSFDEGLKELWTRLTDEVGGIFKSGFSCVFVIIAVSFLCGIVNALAGDFNVPQVKNCLSLVGALAVTAAAAGNIKSVIGMGSEAIEQINIFSKSLLPSLAAAGTASGTPASSLARATATVLFSDILISIIKYILFPLVYILIFASAADAAAPNESLRRISALITKIVSGVLKLFLGAFVSYITVTGIVSGGADKAGLKTAQFAISGTVPVVGGIISEAAGTVMAGASVIKNVIGVFGMLCILSVCITPFATFAVNCFLFKCTAALSAPVIDSRISQLTDNIGTGFGLVLAMVATAAMVIFISIVVSMSSVAII